MSLFNVLIRIREEAPFYSHAWSRKERLAETVLTTLFAARYTLYKKCTTLQRKVEYLKSEATSYRKKLDATLRVCAQMSLKSEEQVNV